MGRMGEVCFLIFIATINVSRVNGELDKLSPNRSTWATNYTGQLYSLSANHNNTSDFAYSWSIYFANGQNDTEVYLFQDTVLGPIFPFHNVGYKTEFCRNSTHFTTMFKVTMLLNATFNQSHLTVDLEIAGRTIKEKIQIKVKDCPTTLPNGVVVFPVSSETGYGAAGKFGCPNHETLCSKDGTTMQSTNTTCLPTAEWADQENVQCQLPGTPNHVEILMGNANPSMLKTGSTVLLNSSQTVQLLCNSSVSNSTSVTCSWLFNETLAPIGSCNVSYHFNESVEVACVASNVHGNATSQPMMIEVVDDTRFPTFSMEGDNHFEEGSSLKMNCSIEYQRELNSSIIWKTPQEIIKNSQLIIDSLSLLDSGLYTCQTEDKFGCYEKHINITVVELGNKGMDEATKVIIFSVVVSVGGLTVISLSGVGIYCCWRRRLQGLGQEIVEQSVEETVCSDAESENTDGGGSVKKKNDKPKKGKKKKEKQQNIYTHGPEEDSQTYSCGIDPSARSFQLPRGKISTCSEVATPYANMTLRQHMQYVYGQEVTPEPRLEDEANEIINDDQPVYMEVAD